MDLNLNYAARLDYEIPSWTFSADACWAGMAAPFVSRWAGRRRMTPLDIRRAHGRSLAASGALCQFCAQKWTERARSSALGSRITIESSGSMMAASGPLKLRGRLPLARQTSGAL